MVRDCTYEDFKAHRTMKFSLKPKHNTKEKKIAGRVSNLGVLGSPDRDWRVLLSIFFLAALVTLFFSLMMLSRLNNDVMTASPGETEVSSVLTINREELDTALETWRDQTNRFEKVKSNPRNVQDPSN